MPHLFDADGFEFDHATSSPCRNFSLGSSGLGIRLAILTQVVVGAGFTHLT
jgi:hypothetical protein